MGQSQIPPVSEEPTRVVTSPSVPRLAGIDSAEKRSPASSTPPPRRVDSEAFTRAVEPQPLTAHDLFPQPGEDFQGFELLSELGRGGMGRVFLARQRAMASRLVVLKVGPHLSRECQKLAKLQHPNIVPVYSFHQEGSTQAVCMPYRGPLTLAHLVAKLRTEDLQTFDGKALTTMIEECRRGREPAVRVTPHLSPVDAPTPTESPTEVQALGRANQLFNGLRGLNYIDAVLTIIRQVAEGLRFAHEARIVHCDLKPANVLISDDGCPQLIDFGIAYDKSNFAVEQFRVGGTRPYMSPEQLTSVASEHLEYDERSDLYGVGVILYELVTGELPFEPNFVSTAAAIEHDCMNRFSPPPSPRSLNPRVPRSVEAIISKCLAPDLANRYQSAKQLHEDLDRQLARRPLRFAKNPSGRELVVKWVTRNRLFLTATGFVLIAGSAAAGVVYQDTRHAALNIRRTEQAQLLEAISASEPFLARLQEAEFFFGLADGNATYQPLAWESARLALEQYHAWNDEAWFNSGGFQSMPIDRLSTYREQSAGLMLLMANSHAQRAIRLRDETARVSLLDQAMNWNRRAAATHPDPESFRAVWLQRAYLAQLAGNRSEAEQFILKVKAIPPSTSSSVLEGRQLIAEGKLVDAHQLLRDAVQTDPRDFWAVFYQAICAQRLGQEREAATGYEVCIALQPNFFGTYYNRGQVHARLLRFADAEADFNRVIELHPKWADGYFFRALTREAQKKNAESIADLTRALELGFTPTSVHLARSRVYARMENWAASKQDRAEGLKLEPTDERGWVDRAQAKLIDDAEGALGDYAHALELNPRSVTALKGQGHLLSRAGKTREAAQALTRIVEISPDSPQAWSGRGVLHARLNDRKAALSDARQALRLTQGPAIKYQVAGIYAMTSLNHPEDRREAFAMLDASLRAGFGFEYLEKDRELDPIRNDPEFKKTVDAARAYRALLKAN